jgi:uncharacterized protein (TIGR02118 family)
MARVKLFGVGVRKPHLSPEDFHDYWRHPHGTWGLHMTTLRGYVQSHQIHTDLLGPEQARFELVAELWFDNEADISNFRTEPVLVKYLLEDEPNFTDMTQNIMIATEEEVLTSGPPPGAKLNPGDDMWSPQNRPLSVKLLHFIGQDGPTDWAKPNDAALSRDLGALRHVRCHPIKRHPGGAPRLLGVQELWWPTLRAFRTGALAAPRSLATLIGDSGRSVTMLVQAERFF